MTKTDQGIVGLAHRRLSIIDLSPAAGQPMFSTDAALAIVYNGEIYNYIELREELRRAGMTFRTQSDTEVLLAAYTAWGTDCLLRLNGMFAFAIWDARQRYLFVARDRFGEKPLYYGGLPGGGIVMASEKKALFAHPDISPDIDEEELKKFAEGGALEVESHTLFRSVIRMPPATAMLVNGDGGIHKMWRYWIPDYHAVRPHYREAEAVEEFRYLLQRSLTQRLRADVRIGACLSGGLDSSVLVGMLAQCRAMSGQADYNTLSARFDDDQTISEGAYIDLMVRHAKINAFSTSPDPQRLIEESQRLHWHQEDPFLSASIYLEWCVMRMARQNNNVVMIDGQGADELLGGYQTYFQLRQSDLLMQRRYGELLRETILFNGRLRRESARYVQSQRRFNRFVAHSVKSLLQLWLRGIISSSRGMSVTRAAKPGIPSTKGDNAFRIQLSDALQYSSLPVQLHSADRSAMAFGVESRFPFLDYALVDWCIGLPDEAFVKDGWQKYILRKAGAGCVPPEIQWRADKVGYAAPLDAWLRGPMKDWAYDRLFSGPITQLDYYDRADLTEQWNRHQSGTVNLSWALWRWISINEWLSLAREGLWKSGWANLSCAETLSSASTI